MKSIGNELIGISKPEWQITTISDDLSTINKFGISGEGAIEENINFYAYDVNYNFYAVADNQKGWLKLYSWIGDSMISYYPLDYHISSFIMIDDTTIFSLLENETGALEFNLKDVKNNVELSRINLRAISGLEMEEDFEYLVFDGWFIKDENYIVIYFVLGGELWVFNKYGEFQKKIVTIDKTPFPEGIRVPQPDGGVIYSTKPEEIFFLDAEVNDGVIYLLNTISVQNVRYIDAYSAATGNYMYSFELRELQDEQLPVDIAITNNYLNVLYEEMTIKRFDIKSLFKSEFTSVED